MWSTCGLYLGMCKLSTKSYNVLIIHLSGIFLISNNYLHKILLYNLLIIDKKAEYFPC